MEANGLPGLKSQSLKQPRPILAQDSLNYHTWLCVCIEIKLLVPTPACLHRAHHVLYRGLKAPVRSYVWCPQAVITRLGAAISHPNCVTGLDRPRCA